MKKYYFLISFLFLSFNVLSQSITPPYVEDFESGQNGWTSGGTNSTWAFGTPNKLGFNSAPSGTNAWVLGGLGGYYGGNELSYVQSPAYDLTEVSGAKISATIAYDIQVCCNSDDGMLVQYSVDAGVTWEVITSSTNSINWYDQQWTGESNGLLKVTSDISSLAGQSEVFFRFLFNSDRYYPGRGFLFDDFIISEYSDQDLLVHDIDIQTSRYLTENENINLVVYNAGNSSVTNFDLAYEINQGSTVTESFSVTIPSFTYDTISFSTTSDLSAEADYNIKAWTSLSNDTLNFNDTLSKKIKHLSVKSPSFPYEVGFNDQFNISNYYSTPLIPPYLDFELEVGDPGIYHRIYVKTSNTPFSSSCANLLSYSNTQNFIAHFDLSSLDTSTDNLLLSFGAESSATVELEMKANNTSSWQTISSIPAGSAQSYIFNISEFLNNNNLNYSSSSQFRFSNPSNNSFLLDNFRMELVPGDDLATFSYNLYSERDLTNSESLSTKIYNYGWTPQSNVEINYQINENAPVSETIGSTIAFRDTLDFTFSTPLDLSADEVYNIKVWTSLTGDEDRNNDTLRFQVENIPQPLLSLPYSIDFEDFNQNSWYGDQQAFDSQRQFDFNTTADGYMKILNNWNEMPSKGLALGAQNGLAENELVLNLNLSDYSEASNNIAIDFDFYKLNTLNPNPAKIFVRGNQTDSWIQVFDFHSKFPNRRDHISIALSDSLAAYGQEFSLFTQVKVSQTQYDLISDGGLLLDNIKVYEYLSNDLTIFKQNLESARRLDGTETLRATISNHGAVSQQNFDIYYRINGGTSVRETVTAVVEPFDTYLYNFNTTLDLSSVGTYNLEIWTDLPTEEDQFNDTLKVQLEKYPNPVVDLPFLVDFNDYPSQEISGDTLLFGKDSIFDFYSDNGSGQLKIGRYGWYIEDNNNISFSSTQDDLNNLVMNVNLKNYRASVHQIFFEFDYIDLGDDEDPEDLVYIRGNDGNPWIEIYDWNVATNHYKDHVKINISDSLIAHGQDFSSSTQIKFAQKGNELLESGGIKIDNLNLFEIVPADLSVISSSFANLNVDLSSTESLTIEVKNFGYETQSAFDVFYQVDGGAPVQETLSNSVNLNDTISYTFNSTLDLSEEKRYEIKVWTGLGVDTTQYNDTLLINVLHTPFLNLPYKEDFENGDPLWEIGGTNSSWELGIPSKLGYSPADGNHAFALGTLNGNYNNNENSYLYTHYYNFTDLDTAFIAFDINYELYGDALKLQYTTDKGASWNDLTSGLENWHSGTGWEYSSYKMLRAVADITPLSGNAAVQFRFYFKSNGYNVRSGAIIDNIEIKEYDTDDVAPIRTNLKSSRSYSTQEQLTVELLNSGFNTQNSFDIYYQLDGGSPVKETVSTVVAFEDTVSYTFSNTLDLSNDGSYQISVWTDLALDQDPDNDTLKLTIEKFPNPSATLPYKLDFENMNAFYHEGDTLLFGDPQYLDFLSRFGTGQIQVFTGSFAINNQSLAISSSSNDVNEFIINLNLSQYSVETSKILLDFDYKNIDDELNEEDKVFVRGGSKDQWLELHDWNTSRNHSIISVSSLDVGALLKSNNQDFSNGTQIKFSQADNVTLGSDGLVIDNIKVYEGEKNDLGVISSNIVNQSGGFTDQEMLSVEIANFAFSHQQFFDIYYQIDNLNPVLETVTETVARYDTMSFSFTTLMNLSEEKEYQIKVWTALELDTITSNDTLIINTTHLPAEDLPYFEDFESGDGAWVSGGTSNSWSYGTPAKTNLEQTISSKAWVLGGLTGSYNDAEESYLESPLMNLSNLDTGYFSLDINYEIENYSDKLQLQYSTDNGASWSILNSSKSENYLASGWYGESNEQLHVEADISHLGGFGAVIFRFYFKSDNSVVKDGAIIDNIEIKPYPKEEISPINVNLKTARAKTSSETLTVEVINNGLNTQSNFDIAYRLNGGSIVQESVSTNLQSSDTMSYSFSDLIDLSLEGDYILEVWTILSNDQNKSNDSLLIDFELYPNPLVELPLEIDFDNDSDFIKEGDSILFGPSKRFDFFTANGTGQVQVFTGSNAIDNKSLGIASSSQDNNELILNLNLSDYTVANNKLLFNFDFKDIGDEEDTEDKVFIRGSKDDQWNILYDWNTTTEHTKINISVNISDSLQVNGQEFSTSTQIKFGQSDNSILSGGDGLVIDNLSIQELSSDDVGVVSTTLDPSGIFTESESLNVSIFNYGYEAKQGFDIYYQIDSGQIIQETVSSEVSAFDSLNYTFNTLIDLSIAKTYQIKVWTDLPNDVNQNNDTLIFNVEQIQILQLPYFQDFEDGDGDWISGGNNSSWEYGVPNKLGYDSVQNNKAWALGGLDSTYNNSELSYIESPLVNFTGQDSLFLSADINYDLESGWDELKVQYSTDQGGTWNDLNTGLSNWFSGGGWSGVGEIMAIADVSELSAFEYVKFRFYFDSDGSVTKSGAVIDNIVIKPYEGVDLILNDYNISTLNDSPGSEETIEVSVFNRGQEYNGAIIEYSLNNQQVYQDTVNVLGAFETQTITLSNTLDFTMQCTNELRISLIAENNSDQTNNIIEDIVYTNSDPIGNLIIADSLEVCINEGILQLDSEINNGTWTGNGMSESGEFDPEIAGEGLHEILFETYEEGCRNYDSLIIEVKSIITGTIDKSVAGQLTAPQANSYHWIKDGDYINETSRTIEIQSSGDYAVELTNEAGCASIIEAGQVLSSNNNLSSKLYKIYPNPARDYFMINVSSELTDVKAQLYSFEGKLLWERPIVDNEIRMELNNRFSGTYILKLISNEGIATEKIILF